MSETLLANRGFKDKNPTTSHDILAQIHWVQGVAYVSDYQKFFDFICSSTKGVVTVNLGRSTKKGRIWEHTAYSTCNTKFYFDSCDDNGFYRVGFSIPGSACERAGTRNCYRLIRGLRSCYKAKLTRLDLKIRVSDELISLDTVLDAGKDMNFTHFNNPPNNVISRKKLSNGDIKEYQTIYFGSLESDCFMRFYDPYICHNVSDSVDIETVFKDDKANSIADCFTKLENGVSDLLIGQLIASLVVGQIKFLDRKSPDGKRRRVSQSPVLDWWQRLLDLIGGAIKITSSRPVKTFERFMRFVTHQTFAGFAAMTLAYGRSYVTQFINDGINNARDTLSGEWLSLVKEHKQYANSV